MQNYGEFRLFRRTGGVFVTVEKSEVNENLEDVPITGKYPGLAREVRRLIAGMSQRAVARKTGVNFSTVGTMAKGDRASSESTIKFARAYGINPNTLLVLSEWDTIPEFDLIDWEKSTLLGQLGQAKPRIPTETVPLPSGRRVGLYTKDGKPIHLNEANLRRIDLEAEIAEGGS